MIYFDTSALVKFVKREPESEALRSWRGRLPPGTELATSELAELEITRTLLRAGVDHQRVVAAGARARLTQDEIPARARERAESAFAG